MTQSVTKQLRSIINVYDKFSGWSSQLLQASNYWKILTSFEWSRFGHICLNTFVIFQDYPSGNSLNYKYLSFQNLLKCIMRKAHLDSYKQKEEYFNQHKLQDFKLLQRDIVRCPMIIFRSGKQGKKPIQHSTYPEISCDCFCLFKESGKNGSHQEQNY